MKMNKKLLAATLSLALTTASLTGCYSQVGSHLGNISIGSAIRDAKIDNADELEDAFIGLGVSDTSSLSYKYDSAGSGSFEVTGSDGTKYIITVSNGKATEILDEDGNILADLTSDSVIDYSQEIDIDRLDDLNSDDDSDNGVLSGEGIDAEISKNATDNMSDEQGNPEDNFDENFDWEQGSYDSFDYRYFQMGNVNFIVPEGYSYDRGDDSYRVYTKNGSEYEMPAYIYQKQGKTDKEMLDIFVKSAKGTLLEDLTEVDDYGVVMWKYASYEFYNEYNEYSYCMVAFSQYTDDAVVLIVRPRDGKYDVSLKNDLLEMIDSMYAIDID